MNDLARLLSRGAVFAAPRLVGATLLRRWGDNTAVARIVETEAYTADDPASHSFGGRTRRNASMFAEAGTAYVYCIHRSMCLNIVTGAVEVGEAVLVRAVEPLDGIDHMRAARLRHSLAASAPSDRDLSNGPGKLCQALDIDLSFDGHCLLEDGGLTLAPPEREVRVRASPRIGISKARRRLLRFYDPESSWISRR